MYISRLRVVYDRCCSVGRSEHATGFIIGQGGLVLEFLVSSFKNPRAMNLAVGGREGSWMIMQIINYPEINYFALSPDRFMLPRCCFARSVRSVSFPLAIQWRRATQEQKTGGNK